MRVPGWPPIGLRKQWFGYQKLSRRVLYARMRVYNMRARVILFHNDGALIPRSRTDR